MQTFAKAFGGRRAGSAVCASVAGAVLLAAFLAAAATAGTPAGFTVSPRLAAAASFVAVKPVAVYCASTEYDWRQYGGTSGEHGLATPGSAEIKLDPDGCRYLRTVLNTRKVVDGFGAALLVLVHEAIHARGETNEGVTDCDAIHEMPRVAVKFFHVKAGAQLRAVMANAWHYRAGETAAYRAVC